jgi:hypothetical protein
MTMTTEAMEAKIQEAVGLLDWDERAKLLEARNWEFLIVMPSRRDKGLLCWGAVETFGETREGAVEKLYRSVFAPGVQIIRSLDRPPQCVVDAARLKGLELAYHDVCIPYDPDPEPEATS